jgi:hypothetical protein
MTSLTRDERRALAYTGGDLDVEERAITARALRSLEDRGLISIDWRAGRNVMRPTSAGHDLLNQYLINGWM